jgi:hypothetical protein
MHRKSEDWDYLKTEIRAAVSARPPVPCATLHREGHQWPEDILGILESTATSVTNMLTDGKFESRVLTKCDFLTKVLIVGKLAYHIYVLLEDNIRRMGLGSSEECKNWKTDIQNTKDTEE